MKPIFQKLVSSPPEGFAFKVIRGNTFDCPWHFHGEYELALVLTSGGYRMVGDHIAPLTSNDLVMVGPNLPHIYQNDESIPGQIVPVHNLLIQFEEDCLGDKLMDLPALIPVRRLLKRSHLGLCITGVTRDHTIRRMQQMTRCSGLERIILFLEILNELAHSDDIQVLASPGFVTTTSLFDQERMNRVCQFIHENLDRNMVLPELARLACLSEGAFSRFFHTHTGKTFPQFVNELRVGRACRLLTENKMTITEIAFACGFSNLSNFNRQFLRLKKCSPRNFRRTSLP
jgi:AraC-like DNA-binding protein